MKQLKAFKTLAVLLAIVLLIGAVPFTVSAADPGVSFATDNDAAAAGYVCRIGDEGTGKYYKYLSSYDAGFQADQHAIGQYTNDMAAAGKKITLVKDVVTTQKFFLPNINLDGNGHTLSLNSSLANTYWLAATAGNTVNFENITLSIAGLSQTALIQVNAGITVTMKNVTIDANVAQHHQWGCVIVRGTLNMENVNAKFSASSFYNSGSTGTFLFTDSTGATMNFKDTVIDATEDMEGKNLTGINISGAAVNIDFSGASKFLFTGGVAIKASNTQKATVINVADSSQIVSDSYAIDIATGKLNVSGSAKLESTVSKALQIGGAEVTLSDNAEIIGRRYGASIDAPGAKLTMEDNAKIVLRDAEAGKTIASSPVAALNIKSGAVSDVFLNDNCSIIAEKFTSYTGDFPALLIESGSVVADGLTVTNTANASAIEQSAGTFLAFDAKVQVPDGATVPAVHVTGGTFSATSITVKGGTKAIESTGGGLPTTEYPDATKTYVLSDMTGVVPEMGAASVASKEDYGFGIRFTATVSQKSTDFIDKQVKAGTIKSVSYGMIIFDTSKFTGDVTIDNLDAAKVTYQKVIAKDGITRDERKGSLTYNVTLKNIKDEHNETAFGAVPFICFSYEGKPDAYSFGALVTAKLCDLAEVEVLDSYPFSGAEYTNRISGKIVLNEEDGTLEKIASKTCYMKWSKKQLEELVSYLDKEVTEQ